MSLYHNKTLYAISSDSVRYTWSFYYFLVFFSSVLGDFTILVATIKYRAFKFPKFIVVIIQHMAVCDIIISLTSVIPMIISLTANGWVLGDYLCYLTAYCSHYTSLTSVFLVCALTTSKLIILKFPLQLWSSSTAHAHLLCSVLWIIALNVPFISIIDKSAISFDYRVYLCNFTNSPTAWLSKTWLIPLLTVINIHIPILIVVSTTISLLIIARRVARRNWMHERLKWQGIMTAVFTAGFCCISFLPYTVFCTFTPLPTDSGLHFYRISWSLIFLQIVGNFYIYSVMVASFREFLWVRILQRTFSEQKGYSPYYFLPF